MSALLLVACGALTACSRDPAPALGAAEPPPSTARSPAASSTTDDDVAGAKLEAWLTAFNAADRAQIEQLNAGSTLGSALLTSRTLALAERTGGFERESAVLVEASPTTRLVLLRARNGARWQCLAFAVKPEAPHAITFMQITPGEPPDAESKAPAMASASLDSAMQSDVLAALTREVEKTYVYPDKATTLAQALRARHAEHAYEGIRGRVAFAAQLTADIQAVVPDRHMFVSLGCSTAPPKPGAAPVLPPPASRMFGEARRLDGNVAYLEVVTFGVPAEQAKEQIRKVMNAAADADALVLDLRRNTGGDPDTVLMLSSYLFGDQRVHLNSIYWRGSNTTSDYFTDPNVAGPKFGPDKPVYVLTSGGTFSAAEEFSYNLQTQKRATIVGEATGGGAHPGGGPALPHGFSARIPSGRAINPISKTNWEGSGVRPDVAVAADTALEVAARLALKAKTRDGRQRAPALTPR